MNLWLSSVLKKKKHHRLTQFLISVWDSHFTSAVSARDPLEMSCTHSSSVPFLASSSCLLACFQHLSPSPLCLPGINQPSPSLPSLCSHLWLCGHHFTNTPGNDLFFPSPLLLVTTGQTGLMHGAIIRLPRIAVRESHMTFKVSTWYLTSLHILLSILLPERFFLSKSYYHTSPASCHVVLVHLQRTIVSDVPNPLRPLCLSPSSPSVPGTVGMSRPLCLDMDSHIPHHPCFLGSVFVIAPQLSRVKHHLTRFVCFVLEPESHCVAQVGLELAM